jgi:hypothetical protein
MIIINYIMLTLIAIVCLIASVCIDLTINGKPVITSIITVSIIAFVVIHFM